MIYVAYAESTAPSHCNGGAKDERLTGPAAQLKSCMEQNLLAHAGCRNRSLVFGPTIVRMSRSDVHLCSAGDAIVRQVNRLWYGRALVALRTYPQWMLRAEAMRQRMHAMMEDGEEDCLIALGNPFQ